MFAINKAKLRLLKAYKLNSLHTIRKKLARKQISSYDTIYHCCTQKTASQWFKAVFSDFLFYKYTGLEVIPFKKTYYGQKEVFFEAVPQHTFVTHLYVDYANYKKIPKPENYKAFFVLRDPRELVVSWYFSALYSHPENKVVNQARKDLKNLDITEGLKYTIEKLDKLGLFEAQKTWKQAEGKVQHFRIFRYEDLANNNFNFLMRLFQYLDIEMPQNDFLKLYQKHKFENYSGGRTQGTEDVNAHYRKGVSGDWKNYFNSSLTAHFKSITHELLDVLEYSD